MPISTSSGASAHCCATEPVTRAAPGRPGPPVLGIDVGGTKLLGCAVDAADPGRPLLERRGETPQSPDSLLEGLSEMVDSLQAGLAADGHPVGAALGVGMPALVGLDGTPQFAPHLPGLTGFPFADLLATRLGLNLNKRLSPDWRTRVTTL